MRHLSCPGLDLTFGIVLILFVVWCVCPWRWRVGVGGFLILLQSASTNHCIICIHAYGESEHTLITKPTQSIPSAFPPILHTSHIPRTTNPLLSLPPSAAGKSSSAALRCLAGTGVGSRRRSLGRHLRRRFL